MLSAFIFLPDTRDLNAMLKHWNNLYLLLNKYIIAQKAFIYQKTALKAVFRFISGKSVCFVYVRRRFC